MARQLEDLDDDSLLEVLDRLSKEELFKMLGVNRRLNRLANEKIRTKVKTILFGWDFRKCSHIDYDKVIVYNLVEVWNSKALFNPTTMADFFDFLAKCSGVKCIDFIGGSVDLPSGVLLKVVQRCPKIECIKLSYNSLVKEDEWEQVLDQIGHQLVHFTQTWFIEDQESELSKARILKMIAEKCKNIKRVDFDNFFLKSNFVAALKMFPKTCWVALKCGEFNFANIIQDIDELKIFEVNLSKFGHRVDRLSSLTFNVFEVSGRGPVRGVEFTGLKKLKLNGTLNDDDEDYEDSVSFLIASRIPLLKELIFEANIGFTEDDYKGMFERMMSVKKLTIHWDLSVWKELRKPRLPRSAIHQLKNLETIHLKIGSVTDIWEPKHFAQQVEQYVDEISSLKKLVVDMRRIGGFHGLMGIDNWEKTLEDGVKRMQVKQSRVEVVLLSKH